MRIQIKSWINGSVLFECEAGSLKLAVEAAVKAKANLRAADLRAANLRAANLRAANLRAADLSAADLRDANLRAANLRAANLRAADLSAADLSDADLSDADLRFADLRFADLSAADLSDADLSAANLSAANLSDLSDIAKDITVPSLHRQILSAIEAGGKLDMRNWHTCSTAHCRAGWAVHLAGQAGRVLEYCMGTQAAAALIHTVSCPELKGKVPNFYATNEEAMADIKRLAKLEPEIEAEAKA